MLKEIFRVFWNELRVVSRDKGILIFIVLAPLLYLFEGLIARTTIRWRFCEEGEHVVS